MSVEAESATRTLWLYIPLPIAVWTLVYCVLCALYDSWSKLAGRSSQERENNRYDFTQKVACMIHATVVGVPCLVAYVVLECYPEDVKFFAADAMTNMDTDIRGYMCFQVVSLAGATFVGFTVVDLAFSVFSGIAAVDSIVHHVAFISAGLLIGGNRILFYNSSAMLSMELSSPFLNCVLLYRNRGDQYKDRVTLAGGCFLFAYLALRILVCTRSTLLLLLRGGEAFPARVPGWQRLLVQAALVTGTGLQFFWLPKIWRTFGVRAVEFMRKGSFDAGDTPKDTAKLE